MTLSRIRDDGVAVAADLIFDLLCERVVRFDREFKSLRTVASSLPIANQPGASLVIQRKSVWLTVVRIRRIIDFPTSRETRSKDQESERKFDHTESNNTRQGEGQ